MVKKNKKTNLKTAIVTGGSKGIGLRIAKILAKNNYNIVICSRNLSDVIKAKKEIGQKTLDAVTKGNLDDFGKLMDVHWKAKKKLSNKISSSSIDDLYGLGIANGALGGKILGAGGGGFMLFYCPKVYQSDLTRAMSGAGLRRMRFKFDFDGSKVMMNIFNRRQSLQRELKLASIGKK